MKKKALIQDFKIEIKKSLNRYLSIFLIVALGVAFFSGIRASQPDMRLSADKFYDESNLMDIRVLSTLGLTEDDVTAIQSVAGVEDAEPAYSADVICNAIDQDMVVKVISLTNKVNQYYITEGRLPDNTSECFVDRKFIQDTGYKIGDKINLSSGTEDDLKDTLKNKEYTIVGIGGSANYLSFERGSSNIGNGKIDSFIVVVPEAFSLEAYTEIYVSVFGARELTSYTKDYDDKVETVVDSIKSIADERRKARYEEVLKEPSEEIADAKVTLAEKEAETNEKLTDAKDKIESGKKDIKNGEKKIADGREELETGKKEIAVNKKKLANSKETINNGQAELDAAKAQLADGKKLIGQKRKEYKAGLTAYNDGYKQWTASNTTWTTNYNDLQDKLTEVNKALEEVQNKMIQLEPVKDLYPDDWQQLSQTEETLLANQTEIEGGISQLNKSKEELDSAKENLAVQKAKLDSADKELTKQEQNIRNSETLLKEKQQQLDAGLKQIEAGLREINNSEDKIKETESLLEQKEKDIKEAKTTLEDKEKDYQEGVATTEKEITDAKQEIADAEQKLKDIKYPKWYVLDRNSIQTYVEYGQDTERIGNIGKLFPLIFFLVAALVSLTTMTRMVEEQRTQIGTLKALGYSKKAIAGKYILYALSASLLGSILGVLVGEQLLPRIIISAYTILYGGLPYVEAPFNLFYGAISTAIAVLCTTLATFFSCYKELMSTPAKLMRPVAPQIGKRVILERFPFIWKRLSFTSKATVRNLLRYKKRFFMTVFGIGGCMALLLVGFGLRDSIGAMSDIQYKELWHQDAVVTAAENISNQDMDSLLSFLKSDNRIKNTMQIQDLTVDVNFGKITKSTSFTVPIDTAQMKDYIVLRTRTTHKELDLNQDGIVITEKLASLLGVSKGDVITISEEETSIDVPIAAITENYLLHNIYMSPDLYEQLYGKAPEYNKIYLKYADNIKIAEEDFASELLNNSSITAVTFTTDFKKQINDMLNNLNLVIYVLIISAGLLAFIVLYNLNNININERKRELATLKVLGFQDMEVAAYVYRENMMLTIIGSLAGIVFGIILHRFVILTTEIDSIMFGRSIKLLSYIYSMLLTLGFSLFVNYVMFYKLKKIDMIESLKSVE